MGALLAALSCLQGRQADRAAVELLELDVDGLQLTAGCAPVAGLADELARSGIAVRTHHGYSEHALRRRVWMPDGALASRQDSIHPPRAKHAGAFFAAVERGDLDSTIVEVMYPGYTLGDDASIEAVLEAGVLLAVDVSHLHIARTQRTVSARVEARLREYEHIGEVHVSANDGRRDSHDPIDTDSYGLGWAGEQYRAGTPVVVESYLHHLDAGGRRRQFDLVRAALN